MRDEGLKVFSSKVAEYTASRPDYPAALYHQLSALGVLRPGFRVADIGAGTGLFTEGLLKRGHTVVAVEPNAQMRAAADAALGKHAGYSSVNGTAEATPLEDSSVDLVTAAQAFHWFDIEPARRELLRILKPHGEIALIWNNRVLTDPLHVALDEVFTEFGGEKRDALLAQEDRSRVADFFGPATVQEVHFAHQHQLDHTGLASLALSRSYMPVRTSEEGARAVEKIGQIFDALAVDGRVSVRYRTVAIIGRP